jgi:glycosyltransferase involved in cell wall biosynthesis
LSYGVDADYFSPLPDAVRKDDRIVFTGQMSSPPNVKGIRLFCDEVLPLIAARRPAVQLWIVGANPAPEVRALAGRDPRIHVTGFVKDMRDFLRTARVSVCPVSLNYGAQTKILEAMACALPVVTWSTTNTGIGAIPGTHLLVAETSADFADNVVRLLDSPDYWQDMSFRARNFIETERSWLIVTERLEQLLYTVSRES